MIDPYNKAILAMDIISKPVGPPRGATICTVVNLGSQVVVNCVGFKRAFPDVVVAAKWLDISWEYLSCCLSKPEMLFLVRRDHLDPWHSTRK